MLDSRAHGFVVTRLALCRENDGSTLSRLRGSHDVLTVPNDVRQIQFKFLHTFVCWICPNKLFSDESGPTSRMRPARVPR